MNEFTVQYHKFHDNDSYREMMGRVAVLHVRGLDFLGGGRHEEYAASFLEARRLQVQLDDLMSLVGDGTPEARKKMRVMIEDLQHIGLRMVLGAKTFENRKIYDIDFPAPLLERLPSSAPIDAAPDALRVLGDFAGLVSFCRIDHLILEWNRRDILSGSKYGDIEQASDRAWQFYWCLAELAPIQVNMDRVLDAGQYAADDVITHTYRHLQEYVAKMRRDVGVWCVDLGIEKPQPLGRRSLTGRALSVECAQDWLGQMLVAYVDGLSSLKNRRSRTRTFAQNYQAVEEQVLELGGPFGSGSLVTPTFSHRALENIALDPHLVAQFLASTMRERGEARMKVNLDEILAKAASETSKGRSQQSVEADIDPVHLEALGMLAAEYSAIVCEGETLDILPYWANPKQYLAKRQESAGVMIQGLEAELDASQVPDDHPVVRTVDYIAKDIKRVMKKRMADAERQQRKLARRRGRVALADRR